MTVLNSASFIPEATYTYDSTPVVGYGDGLIKVTGRAAPPLRQSNNDWITIEDKRYNVHPYRSDLGGYPVRWSESVNG